MFQIPVSDLLSAKRTLQSILRRCYNPLSSIYLDKTCLLEHPIATQSAIMAVTPLCSLVLCNKDPSDRLSVRRQSIPDSNTRDVIFQETSFDERVPDCNEIGNRCTSLLIAKLLKHIGLIYLLASVG